MKNTSEKFKTMAQSETGARYYVKIEHNGVALNDDIDNFNYSAMTNDDESFAIGNTDSAMVTFSINEPSQKLSDLEIKVSQGIDIDGTIEYVKLGIFKVLKPTEDRGVYQYQCVDRMTYLMMMPYFSELTYPTTDLAIVNEICTEVGISFMNNDFISHTISSAPSGYTKREIIAYMAQLQGKNAIINEDGNLEFVWYTNTDYVVDDNKIYYDGTSNINSETDYVLGYIECTVRKDDGTEEKVLKSGNGAVGMKILNPFMTQEILNEVFERIGGFSFRATEFEFLGDFRLEVGDIVTVETNGVTYKVPIMQIDHSSDGGVVTTIRSIAQTDSQSEIDLRSPSIKEMDRYYAQLVLINQALVSKLSAKEADIKYLKTDQLDAIQAEITEAVIKDLSADFADIHLANIEIADIGTLFAKVGLIDRATIVDGHITGYLDAVEVNANNITAGTLTTDRLVIRGTEKSLVYQLNNISGALQVVDVDTLNGEILTKRSVNADKIIAESITANELDVANIFGNSAVLNTLTSQEIFSNAVATNKVVVGAYDLAQSTNTASGSPILLQDSADGKVINLKVYGKSEQSGNPTPGNPIDIISVGDSGTLEFKSCEKNQLNNTASDFEGNGVKRTINKDKSVTVNGATTGNASFIKLTQSVKAGKWIFSGCPKDGSSTTYHQIISIDGDVSYLYDYGNGVEFELETDTDVVVYLARIMKGYTASDLIFYPMIRPYDTDNTYEAYNEKVVIIPLTASLGSNRNGNVVDEIKATNDVYNVHRKVVKLVFDGSNDEGWSGMTSYADRFYIPASKLPNLKPRTVVVCSHYTYSNSLATVDYGVYLGNNLNIKNKDITTLTDFKASLNANPITVIAELIEEVIEPLDQTPFKDIVTFNPITYITNSDNADMEVEYYRNNKTGQKLANLDGNYANWASVNDITLIDGGKIYTGSITSKQIDVEDLFAQDITATGTITGAKLIGADAEITKGSIGGWNINEDYINRIFTERVAGTDVTYEATLADELRFVGSYYEGEDPTAVETINASIYLDITGKVYQSNNPATRYPGLHISCGEDVWLRSLNGNITFWANKFNFANTGGGVLASIENGIGTFGDVKTSSGISLDEVGTKLNGLYFNAESLIINKDLPLTSAFSYTLYSGRKFSDYDFITITIGSSSTDVRQEITIPISVFASTGRNFYLDCHSGTNGSVFNQVLVRYVDDTTIQAYATYSQTVVKILNIYGHRLRSTAS